MRKNTNNRMRRTACGIAGCFIVAVFAVASGSSISGQGCGIDRSVASTAAESGAVAGLLLSPRTRLIIDFQRTALA